MLKGNILDVYPDYKRNLMVTWLINDGKATRIEDNYEPTFYVYSQNNNLSNLASFLQNLSQIKKLNFTLRKTILGSNKHKTVLEVITKNLISSNRLASIIDSWGSFHNYQLFNVDIRLPTRYLCDKRVFCNAYVKWNGKHFILKDEQWSIDYEIPSYKIAYFDIKRKTENKIYSFNNPIKSIVINDYFIEEENETDTILSAVKNICKIDPDIINTTKGDSLLLPFLYHRAKLLDISNLINLGRDNTNKKKCLQPTKEAKSYFSYGKIIHRPAFYTLKGRIHIDMSSSFIYGESGLYGLVDISRCSNIPIQILSRLGPGTAISQIQVNKAMQWNYLIPWKKNMPEICKTAMNMLKSDRGGIILEPIVGLHENVIELDYASLYPNIMQYYNISPETMLCSCCPNSTNHVPQLGYHICFRHKGLIPEVLKPIISRRFLFKARLKNEEYRWIVFLPSKKTELGALNRYYGLFDNGKLKARGIEMRQHNTPKFLKNIQKDMLKIFSQTDSAKKFLELIPKTINVLLNYGIQVINNTLDNDAFVFTTRISRKISDYKVNNLVKSALLQLRDNDINIELGQSARYIVTNEPSRNYKERVRIAELMTGEEKIDVDFYLRHIAKCGESILVPFGYTLEKIESLLKKLKKRNKKYVSILS